IRVLIVTGVQTCALPISFNLAQYLLRRGDARVRDWATLNANAKYYSATRVAAMKNWENKIDLVSDGITRNITMREVMRLVILKRSEERRVGKSVYRGGA